MSKKYWHIQQYEKEIIEFGIKEKHCEKSEKILVLLFLK